MYCQECGKRPAAIHFTKIINGDKTEFHFCESCARDKGEGGSGVSNGFSVHSFLSGLLDYEKLGGHSSVHSGTEQSARCNECGLTYTQFSKIGRFGCSSCYKQFAERLDPLLKRVHGNISHSGKIPKRSGGRIQCKREIEQLRKEMHTHIEHEEFEEAAQLRDRIRELERKVEES